ncbi:MAG: hypothetical protein RJQ09_07605 [Cyclobacteriaceae bacterium]
MDNFRRKLEVYARGDRQFMIDLVRVCLADLDEFMVNSQHGVADKDFEMLTFTNHKIKTISAFFGMAELDKLSDQSLEAAMGENGVKTAHLNKLSTTINGIKSDMKSSISDLYD